jgi:hypothetical protein
MWNPALILNLMSRDTMLGEAPQILVSKHEDRLRSYYLSRAKHLTLIEVNDSSHYKMELRVCYNQVLYCQRSYVQGVMCKI